MRYCNYYLWLIQLKTRPNIINLNDVNKFDDDVSYTFSYTGCQKNDKIKVTIQTPAPATTTTTTLIDVK